MHTRLQQRQDKKEIKVALKIATNRMRKRWTTVGQNHNSHAKSQCAYENPKSLHIGTKTINNKRWIDR